MVRKAQGHNILDGFFAQIMVDAEHGALVEHGAYHLVELVC